MAGVAARQQGPTPLFKGLHLLLSDLGQHLVQGLDHERIARGQFHGKVDKGAAAAICVADGIVVDIAVVVLIDFL